jgi:hypothetical protein
MASRRSDANHPLRSFVKAIPRGRGPRDKLRIDRPRSQLHAVVIATSMRSLALSDQALRRAANPSPALVANLWHSRCAMLCQPSGLPRARNALVWLSRHSTLAAHKRTPGASTKEVEPKSRLRVSCIHAPCATVNRSSQSRRDPQRLIGVRQEF